MLLKGHNDCKNQLARQESQQKNIYFLGYESWEILTCELEFITNPLKTAKELILLGNVQKPAK